MRHKQIHFSVPVILVLSLIVVLVCAAGSFADVRLPAVISDNMVLQQGGTSPIWGWAEPGEKVRVSGSWQSRGWETTADKNGKWMVRIEPPKAGGPYNITIEAKNTITISNVLVGEVWVCSGQSNMQFILRSTRDKEEIKAADYPEIRLFTVKQAIAEEPQDNCGGRWLVCNPQTAAHFSAVAYFFGQRLHKELNVPVGLIHTSWGGSPAEAWTKKSVLESDPQLKSFLTRHADWLAKYPEVKREYEQKMKKWREAVARARAQGGKVPPKPQKMDALRKQRKPAGLYNAMLVPLMPYRIAGVIWYQGESNTGQAYAYRKLFPAMIQNWRNDWGQGDFPFFFVQLANFEAIVPEPAESTWAELREAQLMALSLPNTGMAVIIDIGEADNIHPKNKKDVGRRLALLALAKTYGKDLVYSGPIYKSMKIEGNKIILHFEHIGGGLVAGGGGPLKGFAIAGADRKFVWADAKIDGDVVVVSSERVAGPVAVRYAWADNPVCNLYNSQGLPASPFRTDDWPGKTMGKK